MDQPPESAEAMDVAVGRARADLRPERWMADYGQTLLRYTMRRMAPSFYLYELKGVPKDEICRLMDIKTGNLYVILYRARNRIKRYLRMKWFNA